MATKIRPFNLHTDTETRIQTLAGNLIDSAYVNARVSTVDSAAVQVIIDSDYVKTTLKVGSTNTIFRYVSTANQTSFTGSDANSATLAYNPGAVQVFLNGSLLTPTVDFTTDSGDTITLVSGAALGSELVINTYKDGIITPTNALPIIGGELTGNLTMGDNKKIKLGNDSDAEIFHNSTNTIINDKGTGDILLQVAGTTHFQTNATGVQVPDNKKLQLGTSNDLEIIHDGSNSIINDAGTGDLKLQLGGSDKVTVTSAGASITGTLGVTGAVTANAGVVVDNITIDGTEIDLSSGDLTIDVAGDIMLDADGGDFRFADGGTTVGKITISATDFVFDATTQDRDIIFKGDDGGSAVTALTLDMSAAGAAAFNSYITSTAVYGKDDANTGIQFDGSDVITLHTGGAERMRIESTGRVAIGRTSSYQSAKVTIENNDHGNYLYMGGSTQQNRGLLFTSSVGSTGAAYLGAKHTILAQSGGGEMQFKNDTHTWFNLLPTGPVTQPKLPMFQIAGTGNTTVTGTGYLTYTTSTGFSSSTEYDPDSLFNGANGRFTAPVAGRYYFIFSIGVSFTSSYHYTSLQKNGSDVSGFSRNQQQEDDYDIQVIQGIMNLSVGDYVTAARNNNYVVGAVSRPMFCGFLLG